MVGSSDSASNGSLLFVVGKAFSGEVGTSSLGYLDDNGGLDVSVDTSTKATKHSVK
jgi:hypothetical protein